MNSNTIRNLNSNPVQKFGHVGGGSLNGQVLGGHINKHVPNKPVLGGPVNKQLLGGQVNKHVLGNPINKQVLGSPINKHVLDGGKIQNVGSLPASKHLGTAIGHGAHKHKIHVELGNKAGNSVIHCNPVPPQNHCAPKCAPSKKHCFPWWCLPNYDPWCKPCYPKVCSQPIVVQVPVAVPVEVPVQTPVAGVHPGVPAPAPAAPAEPLMQIPVGSTLTLQALGLGEAAGQVMIVMDKISLPSQINEWRPDAVTATLPVFGLAGPTPAELLLLSAEGQIVSSLQVELIPASPEMAAEAEANAAAMATAALGQ
jgi:hypothetical protein